MLNLRRLTDDDISLVETWLNKEYVKKWYEDPRFDITVDDWMHEIKEHDGEFRWITSFIVLCNDVPIGFCQYYKCEDSDEGFGSLPIDGSYGIDYLLGEESYLKKGLGKEMVSVLVRKVFSIPDAKIATAEIHPDNVKSKKTLLSCGFKLLEEGGSRYFICK